jgi:sec-independent protein translocase protein TatC
MMMFTLPIGLIFEMPVIIYFLAKLGIVNAEFLRKYRRHTAVFVVVAAGIITPSPDVVSQMLVAVPLYLLYEVSIRVTLRVEKKRLEEYKKSLQK